MTIIEIVLLKQTAAKACFKDGIIFCHGYCGAGTMKFSAEIWAVVVFEKLPRPPSTAYLRTINRGNG